MQSFQTEALSRFLTSDRKCKRQLRGVNRGNSLVGATDCDLNRDIRGRNTEPSAVDGARPPETISADTLQDADVVGDSRSAHVEDATQLGILDADLGRQFAVQLHGGHHVHRNAGGSDRMPLRLEPT